MSQERKLTNIRRALAALQHSLAAPIEDDRDLAGIIKGFEIVYELCWTMLKGRLEQLGIPTQGPRDAVRKAWQNGLLPNDASIEDLWIEMIRDRNLTVHTYDEGFAREMVERIRSSYTPAFESLVESLSITP